MTAALEGVAAMTEMHRGCTTKTKTQQKWKNMCCIKQLYMHMLPGSVVVCKGGVHCKTHNHNILYTWTKNLPNTFVLKRHTTRLCFDTWCVHEMLVFRHSKKDAARCAASQNYCDDRLVRVGWIPTMLMPVWATLLVCVDCLNVGFDWGIQNLQARGQDWWLLHWNLQQPKHNEFGLLARIHNGYTLGNSPEPCAHMWGQGFDTRCESILVYHTLQCMVYWIQKPYA